LPYEATVGRRWARGRLFLKWIMGGNWAAYTCDARASAREMRHVEW